MFPCFGDSVASWSNRMPQSRAHTEIFCDSLVGQCPSHEKYLEYFSKFGFLMFLTGLSSDLFTGGRFSRKGYTEIFVAYIATSSQVELLITKNTQKNFQKFWFQRESRLARNLNQSRISRVLRKLVSFLKRLGLPLNFCDYSLFSTIEPLSNPPCSSQKSPLLLIISISIFKKSYRFSYFS